MVDHNPHSNISSYFGFVQILMDDFNHIKDQSIFGVLFVIELDFPFNLSMEL